MKGTYTEMWAGLKELTMNAEAPRDQHELTAFTIVEPKETMGERADILS